MERITSPARRVLEKCGNGDFSKGCEFVAQCTGLKVNGVLRWTYSREKGGAGGLIPAQHQPDIYYRARAAGIDLRHADFFPTPAERAAAGAEVQAA